jgi:hypothetical protein
VPIRPIAAPREAARQLAEIAITGLRLGVIQVVATRVPRPVYVSAPLGQREMKPGQLIAGNLGPDPHHACDVGLVDLESQSEPREPPVDIRRSVAVHTVRVAPAATCESHESPSRCPIAISESKRMGERIRVTHIRYRVRR